MRKKISLALIGLLAAMLLPVAAMAARATTDVTGTVTNNGHTVSGAKVTVICDSNSKKTTTNGSGSYLVTFPIAKCPAGAKVTVVATKSHKGGVSSGTANPIDTDLNVALVNVDLPEFGSLAAAVALLGGAGAFLVTRRRELGQN